MKGFKPFGIPRCRLESVLLSIEEYESIRLVDYELLSHEKAAERMQVSRPTLTRIYNQAVRNIAKAFVEGKAIEISGGNYQFGPSGFRCRKCHRMLGGREEQQHPHCCDNDIHVELGTDVQFT